MRVILDSMMKITEADKGVIQEIKEQLTFSNEKYIQAQKYSKYPVRNIPQFIHYYSPINGGIAVPRGFKLNLDNCIVEDRRIENTVKYPKCKIKLREDQNEALTKYLDDPDKGLILLQTGKGKSILGLYIAYALKQKTLIVVHKNDLVTGWQKDAKVVFGEDIKTGLIKAQKKDIGEQITIATIQTLNRQSEEYLASLYKEFGCVIVDETHHVGSKQYDLINNFEGAYRIGLTATLERGDKLEPIVHHIFGGVAYKNEIKVDDADILPVEVDMIKSNVEYEPKCIYTGRTYKCISKEDWDKYPLAIPITQIHEGRPNINYHDIDNAVVEDAQFRIQVVRDIVVQVKRGKSCIAFFSKKHHIDLYEKALSKYLDPNLILKYYGDSKENKDVMLQRAESKEALITLATYSIATEGTNCKAWEVAFLVSSLNNGKNVEQAVGRVRRVDNIKHLAKVFDYYHPNVYTVSRHHFTRMTRYKKLKFKINMEGQTNKANKGGMFSRGY